MTEQMVDYTPKALKIIAKIFKWLLISVCVAILVWLSLRAIWQSGPRKFKNFITVAQNEGQTVYRVNDYNSGELEKPTHISNVYITENSVQFMLCFNENSDKNASPEGFTYVLRDDKGKEYTGYYKLEKKTVMYTHIKLIFPNISFDGVNELDVKILHNGESYDSCTVYINDGFKQEERLSGSEKKVSAPEYYGE